MNSDISDISSDVSSDISSDLAHNKTIALEFCSKISDMTPAFIF